MEETRWWRGARWRRSTWQAGRSGSLATTWTGPRSAG